MYRRFLLVVFFGMGLLCALNSAISATGPAKELAIGGSAPDFKLPGVDGRDYSLKDFAKSKVLAIIFTCNHCPTAQAYEDRIIKIHDDTSSIAPSIRAKAARALNREPFTAGSEICNTLAISFTDRSSR